jgi:transcriptional regulator with XRE-family HTH domain
MTTQEESYRPAELPGVARRKLRVALRRLRERASLSQQDAARRFGWSTAKVMRIEAGAVVPRPSDVSALLQTYGASDRENTDVLQLTRDARLPGPWDQFKDVLTSAGMEFYSIAMAAKTLKVYEPTVVPTFLQTNQYVQALNPHVHAPSDVERRLEITERQRTELLDRPDGPMVEVILSEAAVSRPVGGVDAMERQIYFLLDRATNDRLVLRVLPFAAGALPDLSAGFTIAEFEDESLTDLVFMHGSEAGRLLDDPDQVADYMERYFELSMLCATPMESEALLRELVRLDPRATLEPVVAQASQATTDRGWLKEDQAPPQRTVALAGGMSQDLVNTDEGIPASQDRLGLTTYVGMLATLIARRDTPLPLSIGVFGEWGSGKSYFMGLLRARVKGLADGTASPLYCNEIVQIGFNAWSYADSNLWASLGDEIFRQLAGPHTDQSVDKRAEVLQSDLKGTLESAQELATAKRRAEQEAAQLYSELAEARSAYASSLKALVTATIQAGGDADLDKVWAKLGVNDEEKQVEILLDETRGAGAEAKEIRRAASRPWARGSVIVGALSFAALVSVPALSNSVRTWVSGVGAVGLASAMTVLIVVARNVRSYLRVVRSVATSIRDRISENSDRRFDTQVARVREAQARKDVLQAELDEVIAHAAEIRRELVDIGPGRRLYGFIAERAMSRDYSGNLGLISTIRHDFQELTRLMEKWRQSPDDEDRRPLDRIVLYIDDLDRCAPSQVVEVLQAVHLLLAMDLFAVVVGVDPRWLVRSLRHQYPDNLGDNIGSSAISDGEVPTWTATPYDYLEKIFNIPFVLPPMGPESFGSLVRHLASEDGSGEDGTIRGPLSEATSLRGRTEGPVSRSDSTSAEQTNGPELLTIDADSELATQMMAHESNNATSVSAGELQYLTEPELEMLSALAPMVETPRQAKRLMNLYRMLRSTQDLSDASRFLGPTGGPGGEYQAVAALLGVLSTSPRHLGQALFAVTDAEHGLDGGLCVRRDPNMTWSSFVGSLEPRLIDGRWTNGVAALLGPSDRDSYSRLTQAARHSADLVTLPDLRAFRYWGPHVARFSFTLTDSYPRRIA